MIQQAAGLIREREIFRVYILFLSIKSKTGKNPCSGIKRIWWFYIWSGRTRRIGEKIWLWKYKTVSKYKKAYEQLEDKVIHLKRKGLCGCVYTQWSDIEDEINGIYTYDRKINKLEKDVSDVR